MRLKKFNLLFIFLFVSALLGAQNVKSKKDSLLNNITNINKRLKTFSSRDTTSGFSVPLKLDSVLINKLNEENLFPSRDKEGLLILKKNWIPFDDYITFRDTIIFDPVFLPVAFEGKILPPNLDFISKKAKGYRPNFHLISPDSTFAPQLERARQIHEHRKMYYTNNLLDIKQNALLFNGKQAIKDDNLVFEERNRFRDLITVDNAVSVSAPEIEKFKIAPVYWIKSGEHKLQLSYNSYSKYWDGDDNFDLFSNQKFTFNYKKKKIEFNNLIEWRLQLKQMTSVDKDKEENKNKDKVNIIEDYIRTYSTYSIKAIKKWAYSSNLEIKTPIFQKLTIDTKRTKQRQFLSPIDLNLGVGMRYAIESVSKKDRFRKFNLSADLSVLSINYKYVRSDNISVKQFGIDEGDRSKTELGSTFNINMSYVYSRYTKYTSRIKYFTNYDKVYAEWENTIDFALNRYFSTAFYFYMKYNDDVSLDKRHNDDTWKFFNTNIMLRFGLAYSW